MSRRRKPAIVAGIVVLWYALVLVWAVRPLGEVIALGTDFTASPPEAVSADLECNNLFSSTPWSGRGLPELAPQPEVQPQLGLPREPCALAQAQARRAFAIDTAVFVLLLGVIAYIAWRPRSDRAPSSDPAGTRAADVPVG